MTYPTISKLQARLYLQSLEAGDVDAEIPDADSVDEGTDEDWQGIATEVYAKLDALTLKHQVVNEIDGSAFEADAGAELHSLLPEHPALADPTFWIWLTLSNCQQIVDWRYPGKRNLRNFGVGGAGENLLYRLWLRAEISYEPENSDAYGLSRVGDIDFWRSHLFRQGYGEVPNFARALIKFQFPATKEKKSRLKIAEIRALAKRLKRARTNLMFEIMSEERAATFIESEWARMSSELS